MIVLEGVGAIVLLGIIGWGWLQSGLMANDQVGMQVRYAYFRKTFPYLAQNMWLSPGVIVPQLATETMGEQRYIYQMVGKYVSIDWDNRVMQLSGEDGASYAFHLQFSQQGASTIFTLDYEDTDYAKNDTQPQVLTVDRGSANELISPFQSGDVILLTWDDARSLTQIKREIAADPERVLNKNYETMVAQRVQRLSVEGQ